MKQQLGELTVADLRYKISKEFKGQEKRNHRSVLKKFVEANSADDATPLSALFDGKFPHARDKMVAGMEAEGYRDSTVRSSSARLKNIMTIASTLINDVDLPDGFSGALGTLLVRYGYTQRTLSRAVGIPEHTIWNWISGTCSPSFRSVEGIAKVESHFKLSPGTLTGRINGIRKNRGLIQKTPHGEKITELSKLDYFLKFNEWTPEMRHEWQNLASYKKAGLTSKKLKRRKNAKWKEVSEGMVLGYAESFFGYCLLPAYAGDDTQEETFGLDENALKREWQKRAMSGEGMRKEDLTLALFSDSDLVKRYLEFKKFRSGNYNTYTKNFSSFCCLLTDAKYGFLTQQPAYADKMKQPSAHHNFFFDDEEENDIRSIHLGKPLREYWKQWCTGNYKDLNAAVREFAVRGQFPMTRDPEEPIRAILALKRPMDALMLLIARMDDNPPAPTWRNRCQAVYLRDRCILALLTSNPLRVKHFKIMTYRKDNSGNLYKTEDGRWRLRFKSSDFKNENGAAKDDYDVGVPEWVWPYVEEYLKWRQHLKCPDATDHLFLVAPNGSNKHRESGEFITSQKISAIVARRTYDHIPEYAPAGFRAHAFRHIIATDYLKNNRGEFHIVAHILHDTLEMVLRKYAKFKVGEGIEIYGEYQARMREEFFKKRKMGENK